MGRQTDGQTYKSRYATYSIHFSIYLKISPQGTIDTHSKQHIKTQKQTHSLKEIHIKETKCSMNSKKCIKNQHMT